MNDTSPAGRGSSGLPGGKPPHRSDTAGQTASVDDDRDVRWHVRARAHAVLAETSPLERIDWDTVQTLLEGAVEDLRAAI